MLRNLPGGALNRAELVRGLSVESPVVIVPAVEAKRAVRLMALARAGFGLALTLKTVPMLKVMDRANEPKGSLVLWARTVGIRDLVLGGGTLLASLGESRDMRRWQAVCLASDGADLISGALASQFVGVAGAAKAAAASLPFVAGGAWALARLPRGEDLSHRDS